jgi:hypothetical protein
MRPRQARQDKGRPVPQRAERWHACGAEEKLQQQRELIVNHLRAPQAGYARLTSVLKLIMTEARYAAGNRAATA